MSDAPVAIHLSGLSRRFLEGGREHVVFSAYQYGELYGLDHTPERLRQHWLGPRTKIKGLWMTGQDTLTCGVTGAMMSGMLTVVGMRKLMPTLKKIYG